jgi:hypothetical protein
VTKKKKFYKNDDWSGWFWLIVLFMSMAAAIFVMETTIQG